MPIRIRQSAGIAAMVISLASGIQPAVKSPNANLPVYGYNVVHAYPHDRGAFTQGLQFADGFLYEGTGLNGRSSIRKTRLETGEVVQSRAIGSEFFGEGISVWKNELIELTWRSQVAFVYDRATFEPRRTFTYTGEGWGLTHDGTNLIMSDGTDTLRFVDPSTFAERRRIRVTSGGEPVRFLNELEYVDGEIYANVWQTNYIVRIAPDGGNVIAWVDLTAILPPEDRPGTDVMNGIAYDAARRRLFVTGKLWPKLFEITLVQKR
jgi:glutaminyl-peptide cyclotransferase